MRFNLRMGLNGLRKGIVGIAIEIAKEIIRVAIGLEMRFLLVFFSRISSTGLYNHTSKNNIHNFFYSHRLFLYRNCMSCQVQNTTLSSTCRRIDRQIHLLGTPRTSWSDESKRLSSKNYQKSREFHPRSNFGTFDL